jgi:hypothetical protein
MVFKAFKQLVFVKSSSDVGISCSMDNEVKEIDTDISPSLVSVFI